MEHKKAASKQAAFLWMAKTITALIGADAGDDGLSHDVYFMTRQEKLETGPFNSAIIDQPLIPQNACRQ